MSSSSVALSKSQQRLAQSSYCSCSKFVPQAFNSNKCQTCFNPKDSHTTEALADYQKSNRKVCKFGYLFIAPSDLELNKTKRWQWRFFVFYDDGELTYSLDDNPLTVPQGRINMSMCEHIAELSNKTDFVSYPNSLCLKFTKPLKDMYIAAGNYEEMFKWKDVICSYASKCQKKNFLINQKFENEMQEENENVPERDTEKSSIEEEDCKEQANSESVSDDSNRRLSYKEDDLIRKQRLKENLNQLLIEYKHEEEANMKKMSKQIQQNRQSLPQTSRNKSSAFSLVAPPSNSSAFRPVNSLTNLLSSQNSLPLQMHSNKLNKTQSSSAMITSNKNNSPSSSSSWSSCSSPAKPRQNEDYKKPCLISPRKQTIEEDSQPVSPNLSSSSSSSTSSTKSLTIRVQTDLKQQQQELDATLRNIEIIDLTKNPSLSTINSAPNSNPKRRTNNLIGYLWKLKDSSSNDNTSNQFNKYWFSLNMNLCCLIYWNDKYEQDIGKFPIGKYELTRCCLVFQNESNSNTNDFRISFHQNTSTITLRASSQENKNTWCDSIRTCIENQTNQCAKCKPKLVVNPMPAFSNSTTPTEDQITTTSAQSHQQMYVLINQSKTQSPSQLTPKTEPLSYEALKSQYEKLINDNSELNSKFKILEQIHLDSVAEYDQQQNRLYNQLDDLSEKLAKTETELDLVNKKFTQIKNSNETSLNEIKNLNETIDQQKKEMEKLNKKLSKQLNSSSELGWNKEVKNLDARISDVLGKIKERELNLAQKSDEALRQKCDRLQSQLVDAQNQILQLKQENSQKSMGTNLQDFSDDLTKVLMSKEEVITQLESQIRDKDRQIFDLTLQLNEEISKTDKFQDAFNIELDRNNQLKSLTDNLNEHYVDELNQLKDELKQSKLLVQNLECHIREITDQKDKSDTQLKNAHESAKNEIETLQEEIKTLEFKLVHSQRQAQEYQTILEDMDLENSQTINQLNQIYTNLGGCLNNLDLNSNSLHNRLKRNQSYVNLLTKQIIELKDKELDELRENIKRLQCEFDAIKEENIDLNDHIYSIDVYMREKEAECDQLKKEKEDLVQSLNSNDAYEIFLNKLNLALRQKTKNMDGLIKFCENIYLCEDPLDESMVIDLVPEQALMLEHATKNQALRDKNLLNLIKNELNELIVYLESGELTELNSQVTSYMAEQLIHKAALNGNLKFACEILRKKSDAGSDGSKAGSKCQSPSGGQVLNVVNVSEQDEKIFKLASELLLSDEDSLRKLSAQVLNEVQHLTQLKCVVNTLKKLRHRYLRSMNSLGVMNKIYDELNNECYQTSDNQVKKTTSDESEQINCILEVIRDIFIQHKNQVSDQLNEVHKLMSISSFNDLVAHLQNENSVLKEEIGKLQEQSSSRNNVFADKKFSTRIFSPSSNFQQKSGSQLRKFGLATDNSSQKNSHGHHILTDLLNQDDTMC